MNEGGGGHELKLGPVGEGVKIFRPLLKGGRSVRVTKSNVRFFLGIGVIGCIFVKCRWLLGGGGGSLRSHNVNMCYIYSCHFIFSLFCLL